MPAENDARACRLIVMRIAGLWLHGPKNGIRKSSSTRNPGASDLADGAGPETPDASIIPSGSEGIGKTSGAGQDDDHASCQRRGAQSGRGAMDHAARHAA